MKHKWVEFIIRIPSKGINEDELKDYAVQELQDEWYEYLRYLPSYANVCEDIDELEIVDYFGEEE